MKQREIKFMIWVPSQNLMMESDDFAVQLDAFIDEAKRDQSKHYILSGHEEPHIHIWAFMVDFLRVIGGTMREWTGLQDRNGRDIYEGDIDSDGYVMTYEWACFRFRKGTSTKPFSPYRYGDVLNDGILDVEVIGNIYHNPELLK